MNKQIMAVMAVLLLSSVAVFGLAVYDSEDSEAATYSINSGNLSFDLFNENMGAYVMGPTNSAVLNVVVPATVTYGGLTYDVLGIRPEAFIASSSLMFLDLSAFSGYIGMSAFQNCINLSSVILSTGIHEINMYAFMGCTSLTTVEFPEGSMQCRIENSAFRDCTNLSSLILPDGGCVLRNLFIQNTAITSLKIPKQSTFAYPVLNNTLTLYVHEDTIITGTQPAGVTLVRYSDVPQEVEITSIQSDVSIVAGSSFSYTVGTDPSTATISISGASWLSVSGKVISGIAATPGTYTVVVTASQLGYTLDTQTFVITVVPKLSFTSSCSAGIILVV